MTLDAAVGGLSSASRAGEDNKTAESNAAEGNDQELSFWTIIADSLDELIGVKDKPHKLLILCNCLLGLLLMSNFWVYRLIPDRKHSLDGQILEGHLKPSIFSLRLWELSAAGIRRNAFILQNNTLYLKFLLGFFVLLTVVLTVLVNCIGIALIKEAKKKKAVYKNQ